MSYLHRSVRRGLWAAGLAALLALAWMPASEASITDDINPLGTHVWVTLSNAGGPASAGTVEIIADLGGGSPYTRVVSFSIAADGQTVVHALFPAPVISVLEVNISENPI